MVGCARDNEDDRLFRPQRLAVTWVLVRELPHWAPYIRPPSSESTGRSFPERGHRNTMFVSSCGDDNDGGMMVAIPQGYDLMRHHFTSTRFMSSSRKLSSFCSCSSCC